MGLLQNIGFTTAFGLDRDLGLAYGAMSRRTFEEEQERRKKLMQEAFFALGEKHGLAGEKDTAIVPMEYARSYKQGVEAAWRKQIETDRTMRGWAEGCA